MSSIDKKAFGISDSLINAVNEALKGGQVKIDVAEPKGKITGADFKKLRKEEVVDEGNPANKEKKNAAAASVGAKNRDGQYLSKMNPSVADKIRGREKMSGKDRQQFEEVQVDEAGMPASVIKSKQNRANMTDKQFADSHKNHSDADLRSMAWRHGLGKPGTPGHDHYVNKRNKGLKEDVEQVDELSKATLGSYVNKSASSLGKAGYNAGSTDGTAAKLDPHIHTINKRSAGIKRAVDKLAKEDTQIDELSTDTYHSAAQKAAKRAMGDVQGRSGPIFKKYAGMANKFRDKGMSQEKKEKAMKEEVDLDWKKDSAAVRASKDPKFVDKMINKWGQRGNAWLNHPALTSKKKKAMKEETDPGFVAEVQRRADMHMVKVRMPDGSIKYKKVRATTDVQHEANDAVSNQIAAKKDAFKTQLQQKIASKQMNVMQAKANKRLSSINASNDKCSCQEGKGKSMTCEMHGDKSKDMKGGNEPITVNPPMREAAELPKKVITKGHEIAKSIIKNRAGVDNPYAVGMAQAKKSAKMNAYRADRDKNKED